LLKSVSVPGVAQNVLAGSRGTTVHKNPGEYFILQYSVSMAYSSYSHIEVETVSFALSLRADPEDKDPFSGLSEDEIAALGEGGGKKRGGRGPCKNKSCVEEDTQYKVMLVNKVANSRKLLELQTELSDMDEEVTDCVKRGAEVMEMNSELQSTYDESLPGKRDLELKLRALGSERRAMVLDVAKLTKKLEKLKKKAEKAASDASVASRSSVRGGGSVGPIEMRVLPRGQMKGPKKHSGVLKFLPQEGRVVWSCCFMPEEDDADGCLDDHSIGVKSTLIMRRSDVYRPFSAQVKIDPYKLAPWKRTQQPATPPVWPPTRRPVTAEGKAGRSHMRAPNWEEQIKFSSSMKSTALESSSYMEQFTTAAQQQHNHMDTSRQINLNSAAVLTEARYRDKDATAKVGKTRKSRRTKVTGNFTPGNGVNKKLAMFEGLHMRNTNTTPLCSGLF
jgi:hypothetical protein